jgi:hypothetical protein
MKNNKKQNWFPNYVYRNASEQCNLNLLKWAMQNECPLDCRVYDYAAVKNNFEIIKWAKENNIDASSSCLSEYASMNNNFEMLKWAKENGFLISISVSRYAAENNNFKILKWVRENGYAPCSDVCRILAKNNNLEMLKWAKENGYNWDDCISEYAARHDNIEMFMWIMTNEYYSSLSLDDDLCRLNKNNRLIMAKWLSNNPIHVNIYKFMDIIFADKEIELFIELAKQGCDASRVALAQFAEICRLPVLTLDAIAKII